ncbi:MAG TPA: ribosomal protein S18-alanine N-acetyltransferase [Burkholderiaceae bacterium]|mgnify:CR=1 FL=1|nr:ribosomal protein S18-alanine N-acetyltransferase [Burkholderiaceae bacterium]HRA79649.1 ribosomal protein S18-alanine N-acetyltransferase [Burkholderiaceae bacterium]
MSALPRPPARPSPGAGLRVRAMRREDLDAVAAIERDVYPFPWSRGNFADSMASGYDAWVFEGGDGTGSALLGYAVVMWIPDEAHLLNLSVATPAQGRGAGRAMLDWLMRDAARRGARGMMLEVRPSNLRAIALYRSCGFDQIGVRKRYYPAADGAREDARVLFRRLADE